MKIAIVEDEKNIRDELTMLLMTASYEVFAIENFTDTAQQIIAAAPDLILLDINLPGRNGQDVCRELRESMDTPIIFVTSDDNVMTEVNSMMIGGDDFISKPYHPSVLLARISAVLKRSAKHFQADEQKLEYRGITLDLRTYKAIHNHTQQVELTKNEFKLLHYLFQRKGEIVPRLDIIEYLWDNDVYIDDNALSVTMTRIRNKLEQIGVTNFIETKRGLGYKI